MYFINSFVAIQTGKEHTKHTYINTPSNMLCVSPDPSEVAVQVKKYCLAACAQLWKRNSPADDRKGP